MKLDILLGENHPLISMKVPKEGVPRVGDRFQYGVANWLVTEVNWIAYESFFGLKFRIEVIIESGEIDGIPI